MKTIDLGQLTVSRLGFGAMGMSVFYGPSDESECLQTLEAAFAQGVTFYDTAEMYGNGHNETLLSRFIAGKRDQLQIATKFGVRFGADGAHQVDNSPDYIREACDGSLKRLGIDCIDLYYVHRIDPRCPIEQTAEVLAELQQAGKIRHIGLSEAAADTIRRAHKICRITAVQSEYSLWTREMETNGVIDTCRELGIGFVPYSPLGRGFLTAALKDPAELADSDVRQYLPRFQGENLQKNVERIEQFQQIAEKRGATPAQLALAYILHHPDGLVPIPGMRKQKHLEDNLGALSIQLQPSDIEALNALFPIEAEYGDRYPSQMMKSLNG